MKNSFFVKILLFSTFLLQLTACEQTLKAGEEPTVTPPVVVDITPSPSPSPSPSPTPAPLACTVVDDEICNESDLTEFTQSLMAYNTIMAGDFNNNNKVDYWYDLQVFATSLPSNVRVSAYDCDTNRDGLCTEADRAAFGGIAADFDKMLGSGCDLNLDTICNAEDLRIFQGGYFLDRVGLITDVIIYDLYKDSNLDYRDAYTFINLYLTRASFSTEIPSDVDGDLILNDYDNCIEVANADQYDPDQDGLGHACDVDFNNNGIVDIQDYTLFQSYFGTNNINTDLNRNGFTNAQDLVIFKKLYGVTYTSGI